MLMGFIFPLIWMLGVAFSIDEMNMCFKGHHVDKKTMMYKSKGYGLQTYGIFRKDTHIKYSCAMIIRQKHI